MKIILSCLALSLMLASRAQAQSAPLLPNNQIQEKTFLVQDNEPQTENTTIEYRVDSRNEVLTGHAVYFKKGSAEILPKSNAALFSIKKFLEEKSYISLLRVEGHVSCGKGDQALSEARALAVCQWLVAKGVDCKRLLPVGFGCTKPQSDLTAGDGRISFVNAALKGHAIGGMPVDGGGKVAGAVCE
jgi:outer membrane protein OmpA-like peptidoglycan-associated protein